MIIYKQINFSYLRILLINCNVYNNYYDHDQDSYVYSTYYYHKIEANV